MKQGTGFIDRNGREIDRNGREIRKDDVVELTSLHPVRGPYKERAHVTWGFLYWCFSVIESDGRVRMENITNYSPSQCEVIDTLNF